MVGAGPAGSVAAMLMARRGMSVVVIDAGGGGHRVRAEHVSPEVHQALAAVPVLGLAARTSAGVEVAWERAEPEFRAFLHDMRGPGLDIERADFERALVRRAAEQGVARTVAGRLRDVTRAASTWQLGVARGADGGEMVRARFVVDATGRSATFARRRGAQVLRADRLCALVARTTMSGDGARVLLVEACPDGWWYSLHASAGDTIAYVTDPQLLGKLRALDAWWRALADAPLTRARVGADAAVSCRVVAAGCGRLDTMYGDGWIAVGDAAMHFDPIWGGGISFAMMLAARATEAIALPEREHAATFGLYQSAVLHHYDTALARRAAEYRRAAARFPTPFWIERS